MHKIIQDALRYIVGSRSITFQVLTHNIRAGSHPRTEERLLLGYFSAYVKEACARDAGGIHAAHLNLPRILVERQGWCREIKKVADASLLNKFVGLCILLRDFDDIRTFVESKLQYEAVAPQRTVLDMSTACGGGVAVGGGDVVVGGGSVAVGGGEGAAGVAGGKGGVEGGTTMDADDEVEVLQGKAVVMVQSLPSFMAIKVVDWWKWDRHQETFKSSIWDRTVQQVNAEASLVFCGEIIQHKHDIGKTAIVFCEASTDCKNAVQYTPEQVMAWYYGKSSTDNMQMVCDMHNFKSSNTTSDYEYVCGLSYYSRPNVPVHIIRMVASYCSVMVERVDHVILRQLLRIDVDEVHNMRLMYEQIHDLTPKLQQEFIAKNQYLIPNCMRLNQVCAEMENMLRAFTSLHHRQDTENMRTTISHLIQKGIFSQHDDVWNVFRKWVVQDGLCIIRSSEISAAMIGWGGISFVRFACNAQADGVIASDDVDADDLHDHALISSFFEDM